MSFPLRHRTGEENSVRSPLASGSRASEWGDWIERRSRGFFLLFVAAIPFSISVTEIAAGLSGFLLLLHCLLGRDRAFHWDMVWVFALFALASVLAATFSLDPRESFIDSKDLSHFFIFYFALNLTLRMETLDRYMRILVFVGGVVAVVGLFQAAGGGIDLYNRISGFNSIYMTYAGLLMLFICQGAAILAARPGDPRNRWVWVSVALMVTALILSLTRMAWMGLAAGLIVLILGRNTKFLWALPVVGLVLFLVAPDGVRNRMVSVVDLRDYSNRERLMLWSSGVEIIKDYPLLGVGQNSFPLVYPEYRHKDVAEPNISHLHNNVLEIAAERGLIGLAAWLAIWIVYYLRALAVLKRCPDPFSAERTAVMGSLAGVTAFLVAGMFEYNFGAAQIHLLVYLLMAFPFIVERLSPIQEPS
jgi:O-antigen ligase